MKSTIAQIGRWIRLKVLGRVICPRHGETERNCLYPCYSQEPCDECRREEWRSDDQQWQARERERRVEEMAEAFRKAFPNLRDGVR